MNEQSDPEVTINDNDDTYNEDNEDYESNASNNDMDDMIDTDSEIDPENDNTIDQIKNEVNKEEINKLIDDDENKYNNINDEDDDEDEEDDEYYQKFTNGINSNYLEYSHPESNVPNYFEIEELSKTIRDNNNVIVDDNHKTIPILTKYEKTRILGQRAKQINNGANPYINVPENIIDGYLIAEMELKEKKIPFIIRRPIPNGKFEYWKVKDLEIYY